MIQAGLAEGREAPAFGSRQVQRECVFGLGECRLMPRFMMENCTQGQGLTQGLTQHRRRYTPKLVPGSLQGFQSQWAGATGGMRTLTSKEVE